MNKTNSIIEHQLTERNVEVCKMNTTPSLNWKDLKTEWVLIDAKDQVVGKLATVIANILRGKDQPNATHHVKNGKAVIVINADQVVFTGRKEREKKYYSHSQYQGGLKVTDPKTLRREGKADRIIHKAVSGMLGRGRMAHQLQSRLRVFTGSSHSHEGQKPTVLNIDFQTKKTKTNN